MKYKWNSHEDLPEGADPGYGRSYDATGAEILDPVVWMDTDTGEVICFVPADKGTKSGCKYKFDGNTGKLLLDKKKYAAPLTFAPGHLPLPDNHWVKPDIIV